MTSFRLIHIASTAELRAQASAWDDLWWRGDAKHPTSRAELLAQWVEHFAPRAAFHAIVAADQQRWIAALPLVASRAGWLIPAGKIPENSWSSAGDLLLDSDVDPAAADFLIAAAAQLPWSLLWLDEVRPETQKWKSLLRACDTNGFPACYHERFRVGRVEIDHAWLDYQKRLPKSHRQGLNRALRRLKCEGEVRFDIKRHFQPGELEPWIREACAVEDSGWKGNTGTSVIRTPGLLNFFLRQADQLAKWNQLETAALRLGDRMLAFIYGYRAKGVYFAHKIGYDQRFAAFSPGQLLFNHVFEQLHADPDASALDFMGPLTDWQLRWRPSTYALGRAVISTHPGLGRAALYAYKHFWRPLRDRKPAPPNLAEHEDKSETAESMIIPFPSNAQPVNQMPPNGRKNT